MKAKKIHLKFYERDGQFNLTTRIEYPRSRRSIIIRNFVLDVLPKVDFEKQPHNRVLLTLFCCTRELREITRAIRYDFGVERPTRKLFIKEYIWRYWLAFAQELIIHPEFVYDAEVIVDVDSSAAHQITSRFIDLKKKSSMFKTLVLKDNVREEASNSVIPFISVQCLRLKPNFSYDFSLHL